MLTKDLPLLFNSFEFFKERRKHLQPHLRMLFVKTITNAWHTSSRMHEDEVLPCIFGCNHLPCCTLATPSSSGSVTICDETAPYLICPSLTSLIADACHLEPRPSLHDLIYGNGRHDSVGASVCATASYVYHALKLGNKTLQSRAISTGSCSLLRAAAHSSAKAFWNEFGIQSFRFPPPSSSFRPSSAFVDTGSSGQAAFYSDT